MYDTQYEPTSDDIKLLKRVIYHYEQHQGYDLTIDQLADLVTRMMPLCGAVPPVHTVPGIYCILKRGHDNRHEYHQDYLNDLTIWWSQRA